MVDTIASDTSTTATLNLEFGTTGTGTFSSRLDPGGDVDWIRITLTAGQIYSFYAHAQHPGQLGGNTITLQLLDANGTPVASYGYPTPGNPQFKYTPTVGGTYYLAISDTQFGTEPYYYGGEYSILATTNTSTDVIYNGTVPNPPPAGANQKIIGGPTRQMIDLGTSGLDGLGEQGDDQINGNALANMLSGGLGNDALLGVDGPDLLFGDPGDDWLFGGNDSDRLRGGDGVDILQGQAGFDHLDGGAGGDYMLGGTDNDTYIVDDPGDVVREDPGGGTADFVVSSINYVLPDEVEYLRLTGTANINATGNGLANILIGNNANNILDGRFGTDRLEGELGNDTYVLADGNDTVIDTGGTDTITSTISRSLGSYSGIENLTLVGTGAINATGNSGRNVLTGNSKINTLNGGGDNDTLIGGGGNDKLKGGAGRDTMTGGTGADDFIFTSVSETGKTSATRDRITDFKHGSDDLDLSAIDANGSAGGNGRFTLLRDAGDTFNNVRGELRFFFSGSNTVVEGDVNGDGKADFQIQLAGRVNLTPGDIIP